MALRKVFAWQKRAARRLGITDPMCGAIGFVQRFGSLVNLNCHFHNILPDGVFAQNNNGDVVFRPVPPPSKRDVQTLVKQIARGTEKLIAKRGQQDGRRELRFGQAELLQKLAILILPPHKNLTRYFGVFAPAHRYRSEVVALGRDTSTLDQEPASADANHTHKRGLPWAELLRRVFAIDILKCDQCGGDMKIIAIIPASEATEAILDPLGKGTHHNPATGPPADRTVA